MCPPPIRSLGEIHGKRQEWEWKFVAQVDAEAQAAGLEPFQVIVSSTGTTVDHIVVYAHRGDHAGALQEALLILSLTPEMVVSATVAPQRGELLA